MPTTSPRTLSSGPPELPGLMAASVCSMLTLRCGADGERPAQAADDADRDGVVEANGLPIAITQSPGCICSESPNLASASASRRRLLDQLDEGAVGERIAADDLRVVAYSLVARRRRSSPRSSSAPSTTWLLVRMSPALVDDEAGAGALGDSSCGSLRTLPCRGVGGRRTGGTARRRRRTPSSSCVRARLRPDVDDHRRSAAWRCCGTSARRRARQIGALFIGGAAMVCADEAGDRSRREAMHHPDGHRGHGDQHGVEQAWSCALTSTSLSSAVAVRPASLTAERHDPLLHRPVTVRVAARPRTC